MLANYLIGLREGLEAGLIVSILVAYLGRLGRRDLLPKLWIGISGAIVLALGVGAILTWGPYGLSFQAQEALGGSLSIVAVGLVTWMVLWMATHARTLKGELQRSVDLAVGGSAVALVVLGIVSVGREGVETALFVWASIGATGSAWLGFLGAILGILTAVVISILISVGIVRINLAVFFRWTGVVLVVVAAGVLAYGIGDLQESGLVPGASAHAWDVSAIVPPTSWWGVVLAGVFSFTAQPTWAQVVAWVLYVVVVGALFLRRQSVRRPAASASEAAAPQTPPARGAADGATGSAAAPRPQPVAPGRPV